uniref:Uncharacterized protein n=1 Tax=Avena sativa TaxID=4498 RepID=A0ACD6AMR4_AVESA
MYHGSNNARTDEKIHSAKLVKELAYEKTKIGNKYSSLLADVKKFMGRIEKMVLEENLSRMKDNTPKFEDKSMEKYKERTEVLWNEADIMKRVHVHARWRPSACTPSRPPPVSRYTHSRAPFPVSPPHRIHPYPSPKILRLWALAAPTYKATTSRAARLSAATMPSSTSNIEAALKRLAKKNDLRGAKDEKGETVLHFAASQGCVGSCQFLVEELGLDVNSASKTGVTPMLFATFEGNVQVMRYLLGCGGDPAMPDETGCTPLHIAAEKGHCEAVRLLLSQGVCVDPIDHRGTPLHLAAAKDHDQVVKVLLEHGADAGADVNAHGYSGPTPLTEAVDDGLTDFVKVLLEAGADPNIPNQHGAIPIEVAAARGRRKLVEILFPGTKPISSLPDWSVDGIIRSFNSPHINPGPATVSVEERIADLKSQGKEAFAKKDYLTAIYFYGLVMEIDPFDAAMFANRSLCWLRKGEGDRALVDAQQCKMMRPDWSKAWYREGAALSFMKDYAGAAAAFQEALRLDPRSNEIKEALREAVKSMEEPQCV